MLTTKYVCSRLHFQGATGPFNSATVHGRAWPDYPTLLVNMVTDLGISDEDGSLNLKSSLLVWTMNCRYWEAARWRDSCLIGR